MVNTERTGLTLSDGELHAIFPFHIVVGPGDRVVSAGAALARIAPEIRPGVVLADVVLAVRPEGAFARPGWDVVPTQLYTLRVGSSGLMLRGQMRWVGEARVFLGSPWLTDTAELERFGLSLADFAVHDPTPDLLSVLQLQKIAVDDLQRLTSRLREQSAELEEGVRTKDAFLATMSHELRTPLTGILGLAEAMIQEAAGPITDQQRRYLEIVRASGARLLEVVNDILDLAKIQAGHAQLDKYLCPVAEICAASLEAIQSKAEAKGQKISFENHLPGESIHVDGRRIKQVIDNLLENASKFTPKGGEFGLRVAGDAAQVRFEVWDRGVGIAPEGLKKLFTAFVQLDTRLARRYDGTGLGLVLVKLLVEMHGGRAMATSELGAGSCFSFVLPREELGSASTFAI